MIFVSKIADKRMNDKIKISEGNFVLKNTKDIGFMIFDLPAKISCPYATDWCKKYCYAKTSQDIFKDSVLRSRMRNMEESKKESFVEDMIDIISFNLNRPKYKSKQKIYFRFHGSGDIYSKEYLDKIIKITDNFKSNSKISFQTYTKSLVYLENYEIEKLNIKILHSIVPDTKDEDILKAERLGLSHFVAKTDPDTITLMNDDFVCKGDCSECQACYERNNLKNIYVEIHGGRIPNKKKYIGSNGRIEGESKNYRDQKKTTRF